MAHRHGGEFLHRRLIAFLVARQERHDVFERRNLTLGAGGTIDTQNLKDPIVAFVLGQKGLMYNLSFEGTKFTKEYKE